MNILATMNTVGFLFAWRVEDGYHLYFISHSATLLPSDTFKKGSTYGNVCC